MKYDQRLAKLGVDQLTVKVALDVINEEERNITYQRPPTIIQDVMRIVEVYAKQEWERKKKSANKKDRA